MLNTSASFPCTGGIIAPPRIIIIKKADPCEVYFPRPAILKVKIQGHIMEQNKPPDKNANKATLPWVKRPTNIPIRPSKLNIFRVVTGLSLAKKNPIICTAIQIAKNNISLDVKGVLNEFTRIITPKAA